MLSCETMTMGKAVISLTSWDSSQEDKIGVIIMCGHLKDFDADHLEDGWAINGCCGGGCYTIDHIIFCPFCGEKIH